MNKIKANICTLLLAIVLFGVWICLGAFGLGRVLANAMAIWYMLDFLDKFRHWLMESES